MKQKESFWMGQHIEGGPEATAGYYAETRQQLMNCLEECLTQIALAKYNFTEEGIDEAKSKGERCHEDFFNSMKGGTNLSKEDISRFLVSAGEKYGAMYAFLDTLSKRFRALDLRFEVQPPDRISKDPYWYTGPFYGSNILIGNGAFLFAVPPCTAETDDYMALRQEPVAARLLLVNRYCMLFMNHDQDPGEEFYGIMRDILPEGEEVTSEIEGVFFAMLFPGSHLVVEVETDPGYERIIEWIDTHGVHAVLLGNQGDFTARIITGDEGENILNKR